MRDNSSAQDKLLMLIRKGKSSQNNLNKKDAVEAAAFQPSAKRAILALAKNRLNFFTLNSIIWSAFALACIYLVFSFISPLIKMQEPKIGRVKDNRQAVDLKTEAKLDAKPLEFYLSGVNNRQIFGTAYVRESPEAGFGGINLSELVKDISLVGILGAENPQAVIEDKKTQKTYYVTKGQFIGEIQVVGVFEGKIILEFRGQRFELYL